MTRPKHVVAAAKIRKAAKQAQIDAAVVAAKAEVAVPALLTLPAGATQAQLVSYVSEKKKRMEAALAAQPRVEVFLPATDRHGDPNGTPVTLNGVHMVIARGVAVEVPQQVADILAEADVW